MTKTYCDCCGKEMTSAEVFSNSVYNSKHPISVRRREVHSIMRHSEPMDLCENCQEEFDKLYFKLSKKGDKEAEKPTSKKQKQTNKPKLVHAVTDLLDTISFESRDAMEDTWNKIMDHSDKYGFITVKDIFDICGLTLESCEAFDCYNVGWTEETLHYSTKRWSKDGIFSKNIMLPTPSVLNLQ